ncbi:Ribosome biogenesis ATPase RIX7 [Colletotrichum fructicola]|nr:Ribosome biogenesis ATPase RIX7 [Colletotrichum fructicola]KAF4942862.1 Ribosome biogenesis ATPase RIX7 [Colletotrichum fructicola]KAF5499549.1 Ribosome biogenesis ATPase RIX7 [Colletotrichum fructicola]
MNPQPDKSEFTQWSLYSFDYDGERLVPIWTTVRFKRFIGERDITSLECYPLSLHESNKDVFEEQKACGELFLKCIRSSTKHHYYSGWTFITGLFGETFRDHEGKEVQFPEHMESEIVVDFKETLQSYPGWETMSGVPLHFPAPWEFAPFAEIPLKIWEEGVKAFPQHRLSYNVTTSIIIEEQKLYRSESSTWLSQDPFLDRKANWQEWTWSDEDLVLLPRRAFAYILRERKFTRIDVRSIEFNTEQGNLTLEQIRMKPERRRMIRSAVAAHFRGKQGPSTSDLDPVRGKGKGLVILLHGAPGVGKTATAEAVAAETERPLFPITCGDLGFSPAAVERSLQDIFRYAHLWNCILLFDEADVFLTQRERGGGNLERNALVGVFLRVLEYYSGILFLTTNRVGALDEGFRSRVHLSLCYPNLSLIDTIKILEANLQRLPRVKDGIAGDGYLDVEDESIIRFVSDEYDDYSRRTRRKRGPWNGRQIRNAVQIAAGLALYDKQIRLEKGIKDESPATLTAKHFEAVADTTDEFEEYLNIVKIGDQEDQAKRRQERDARSWPDIGTLQEILYFLPRELGKIQGHDIPTYLIELNPQIEDARTKWAEDVEQAESSNARGEAARLDRLRTTTMRMTMTWKTTIYEINMMKKKNRTSIPMSGALREEEQGLEDNYTSISYLNDYYVRFDPPHDLKMTAEFTLME